MILIYVIYVCLYGIADSTALQQENRMLRKVNLELTKALSELEEVGAEVSVGEAISNEQVADDGGCYKRCRKDGGDMNECQKNCPFPGVDEEKEEEEVQVGMMHEWHCHNYESGESDAWCQKAGYPFVFTRGNNDDYPGCGGCWCCKRLEWVCADKTGIAPWHYMKPRQECDTRWSHVTYWGAQEEYCKNDKKGWGCEYGYKWEWPNHKCCDQFEGLNTNKCRCR